MSVRQLLQTLLVWAVVTAAASLAVRAHFALVMDEQHPIAVVASVWSAGQVVARQVLSDVTPITPGTTDRDARIAATLVAHAQSAHPGATLVHERIVAEGPVLRYTDTALALSFVAGRDGIAASLAGRTAYVTPDELLSRQAYDHGVNFPSIQLSAGLDVPLALALLSERLNVTVRDMLERGSLTRIRVVRAVIGAPSPPVTTPDALSDDAVRASAIAAGRYLARGVDPQGRFRYLVDAPTNRALTGYDWPRHAGATYFMAQISRISGDPEVRYATLRAAGYLRDQARLRCGEHRCIGEGSSVDVGSTALTVIAFVEVARTGLDPSYRLIVPELTAFLREQQRADGEFMHEYDRDAARPIDVQLLYYSGEAALALSRAHALMGDPRDLEAAAHAVEHLTTRAWTFFGARYYWGEEHWTCQAMDDLWDRRPQGKALDFCLGWQAFGRKLQYRPGETPFDGDGAYGFGPFITPRLTPAGSRTEAAIATLDAATRSARVSPAELDLLKDQIRRALALLMRQQFLPGPTHLFADPSAVEGAVPGTEVDWQLRIDYAQHAGSAMVRWLERSRRAP